MTAVSLVFLVTGLVLGVYAMLYGTERRVQPALAPHERRSEHDPAAEPSPVLNMASLAAFAVGFGLTGYLLERYADLGWLASLVIACGAGVATLVVQSLLIARWAIPSARHDQTDERYLLQGTLGVVVQPAPVGGTGRMTYALDGKEYSLPVRDLHNGALAAGTEVVMDRVDQGVAYAEPWSLVEQRI